MAKIDQLADLLSPVVDTLQAVATQLDKAKDEIVAALGGTEIPQAAMDKINQLSSLGATLKTASQTLDDLNPDQPPTP